MKYIDSIYSYTHQYPKISGFTLSGIALFSDQRGDFGDSFLLIKQRSGRHISIHQISGISQVREGITSIFGPFNTTSLAIAQVKDWRKDQWKEVVI